MAKEREIDVQVRVNQNGMIRTFGTYKVMASTQKEAVEKVKSDLEGLPFEIVNIIPLRKKYTKK